MASRMDSLSIWAAGEVTPPERGPGAEGGGCGGGNAGDASGDAAANDAESEWWATAAAAVGPPSRILSDELSVAGVGLLDLSGEGGGGGGRAAEQTATGLLAKSL